MSRPPDEAAKTLDVGDLPATRCSVSRTHQTPAGVQAAPIASWGQQGASFFSASNVAASTHARRISGLCRFSELLQDDTAFCCYGSQTFNNNDSNNDNGDECRNSPHMFL